MKRVILNGLVLLLGMVTGRRADAQPAATIYGPEPPASIRTELGLLRDGKADDQALRVLAESPVAAPYVRRELVTLTGRAQRDARVVLERLTEKAESRNKVRAQRWVRDGRFDLFAEFASGCADETAVALADHVLDAANRLNADAARVIGGRMWPGVGVHVRGQPDFRHYSGTRVTVPPGFIRGGLVRAHDCRLDVWERDGSLVLVSGSVTDLPKPPGGPGFWYQCVAVVNGLMPLAMCQRSVIVVDGDIELWGSVRESVVIASGEIRMAADAKHASADRSVLAAGGDIAPIQDSGGNYFHAGGRVRATVRARSTAVEGRASLPFGVRFLDPTEFGIRVAAQNGGIQVMAIAPDSVFAHHGIEDADIIVRVEGEPVDTLPDFRRALRQGVVRESLELTIRRGDLRLTRIVFLDDVPVPTAPPPRPRP